MPLSKAHKQQTRERIVAAAATAFRTHGFEGVGIDAIMAAAGLTRGGFYAHFRSKEALFAEVLRLQPGLLRRLRERPGEDAGTLGEQGAKVMTDYLASEHLAEVGVGCSLVALSVDVARSSEDAQAALTASVTALLAELQRGGCDSETAANSLSLAVGALTLAKAVDDTVLGETLLRAASEQVEAWQSPGGVS